MPGPTFEGEIGTVKVVIPKRTKTYLGEADENGTLKGGELQLTVIIRRPEPSAEPQKPYWMNRDDWDDGEDDGPSEKRDDETVKQFNARLSALKKAAKERAKELVEYEKSMADWRAEMDETYPPKIIAYGEAAGMVAVLGGSKVLITLEPIEAAQLLPGMFPLLTEQASS